MGDCTKTMTVDGTSYRLEGCDRLTLWVVGEEVVFVDGEGVRRTIE